MVSSTLWLTLAIWLHVDAGATEPPLAIPAAPPSVEAPDVPSVRVPPVPAFSDDALRTYRRERIALTPITETRVATTYETAYAGRWGFVSVPVTRVYANQAMGVFQGNRRLDVPGTLGALGQTQGRAALEQRIARQRGASGLLTGAGLAGAGATVVGMVGLERARSLSEAQTYATVTSVGIGAMLGGLITGAIPAGRARRLQFDHTATLDEGRLANDIEAHNAALAARLGLPSDVDTATPARRRK